MSEESTQALLSEIRDLQRQQLAATQQSLANQQQALAFQQAAVKRQEEQRRSVAKLRKGTRLAVWAALFLATLYILQPLLFLWLSRKP